MMKYICGNDENVMFSECGNCESCRFGIEINVPEEPKRVEPKVIDYAEIIRKIRETAPNKP